MPAFFFTTDEYIHGIVMANYTSGAPVRGNLTIKASIRPIRPIYRPEHERNRQRFGPDSTYYDGYDNMGSYNRPHAEIYFKFVS